ncbi:MAG: ABC transporter permease [Bacillota bacterium]|nr:ABC transporter permease [Bacillota bacterium]
MLEFIGKRLLATIPVLIGVSIVVFVGMHLIPGDPAQILLGDRGSPEELAALRAEMGLDRPVWVQYLRFAVNAVRGDLGLSYRTRNPVTRDIADAFPLTIELSVTAMLLAVVVAVPSGVLAATRQYSLFDNLTMVGVLVGVSMPVFWIALLLMLLFGYSLRLLPLSGVIGDAITLGRVTGFPLMDSILTLNWPAAGSVLMHLVMPSITLATIPMAIIARMTRSSMLEVLRQDYVRTARAKGLAERTVIYRHALKNALIPVVTVVGLQFGGLLSGAVITETVFARPGLGRVAVTSILFRDYAAVQGIVLVGATVFVIVNLLVDVLYGVLDPRIRVRGGAA